MKDKILKLNRKVLLGLATLVLIVAIIAISSFIPFLIDFSKITTAKFITNELIIIVITISATVTVMFIAQASNGDNPRSDLCRARVDFQKSLDLIDDLTRFYQWVKKVLRVQDKKEIVDREMMRIGLETEIYYLEDYELKALSENPQKFGDKFYKKISVDQYSEIMKIKKMISKLKFVSPNYYTTVKNIEPNKTNSERAASETKKKVYYVLISLTSKIILTLIFAVIVASLVIDTSEGGLTAQQAWMDFLSRMFSFVSSAFLGWCVGSKLNDIDAFYIVNRIEAHRLYREDKTFVKADEGKEEYIERVKREQIIKALQEENKIDVSLPIKKE